MKLMISIVLSLSLLLYKASAQTGVPDTLAYLQTVVANKANYIDQPFSALLSDLQIGVKYFSPASRFYHNQETSTSIAFYFSQTQFDYYLTYPRLEIYWQQPKDMLVSHSLWQNNNYGCWNSSIASYYNSAIISDIRVVDP